MSSEVGMCCPACGALMYQARLLKGYDKTGDDAERSTCALHGPLGRFRHIATDRPPKPGGNPMTDQTADPVSVTLNRADWQALLDAVPVTALTYGSAAWGVYQDVQRAITTASWGVQADDKPTEGS